MNEVSAVGMDCQDFGSMQILSTYIHIGNVAKSQGWLCNHVHDKHLKFL